MKLPFVIMSRARHDHLSVERQTLLDALRNAHDELRRYHRLIASLGSGDPEVTEIVLRARGLGFAFRKDDKT